MLLVQVPLLLRQRPFVIGGLDVLLTGGVHVAFEGVHGRVLGDLLFVLGQVVADGFAVVYVLVEHLLDVHKRGVHAVGVVIAEHYLVGL